MKSNSASSGKRKPKSSLSSGATTTITTNINTVAASTAPSKNKLTREQAHRKEQKKVTKQRQAKQAASGTEALKKQKSAKQLNKKAEKISTRFKYASFNQRLQDVHLPPSAISSSSNYRLISGLDAPLSVQTSSLASSSSSHQIDDNDLEETLHVKTSFAVALAVWAELNMTIPFRSLRRQLGSISHSLPQLLHHRSTICSILVDCLSRPDQWLAWDAALDLLPRLANDLGSEFLPVYPDAFRAAIHVTTSTKHITGGDEKAAALIVERGFQTSAWILKAVSPFIVSKDGRISAPNADAMQVDQEVVQDDEQQGPEVEVDQRTERLIQTWQMIRPYLGWKAITANKSSASLEQNDGCLDEEEEEEDQEQHLETKQTDDAEQHGSDDEEQDAQPRILNTNYTRLSTFTRRFASEAFAHLLRKTRGQQLANIVGYLLSDLEEMIQKEDLQDKYANGDAKRPSVTFSRGVAGVWAEGCKSVENRLHSKTVSLLLVLFQSRNNNESSQDTNYAHVARLVVGRLVIMALIHHSHFTHLGPVVELLVNLVEENRKMLESVQLQQPNEGRDRQLIWSMVESVEWLSTAVGVRKGTRIANDHKSKLFALLLRLSPLLLDEKLHLVRGVGILRTSIVTLFGLSIPVGRIQDLIGPGIKLIESLSLHSTGGEKDKASLRERLWPEFSGLVEALADPALAWTGFRQFALPIVLTAIADTSGNLERSQAAKDQSINLLERLQTLGQLEHIRTATPSPAMSRWTKLICAEIQSRLETMLEILSSQPSTRDDGSSDPPVFPSLQLLEPLVPAVRLATVTETAATAKYAELLVKIVGDGLLNKACLSSVETSKSLYEAQPINPSVLLGLAFESLGVLEERNYKSKQLVTGQLLLEGEVVLKAIRVGYWHRASISGLAKLAVTSGTKRKIQLPKLDQIVDEMAACLMSADPVIRLAALELLSLIEVSDGSPSDERYFANLVEVEQTPLAVASVRDRNVRMRKVGRELGRAATTYKQLKEKDAQNRAIRDGLIIRYMVGSFKINLKPIWDESIKALADLVNSNNKEIGHSVFSIAFAEIEAGQLLASFELTSVPELWTQSDDDDDQDRLQADEVEPDQLPQANNETLNDDKQFRDPQLLNRRQAIRKCIHHARSSIGARDGTSKPARTANMLSTTVANAIEVQRPETRLDLLNYRQQILKLFQQLSSLVERYNVGFVNVFLRDAGPRNFAGVLITPLDEIEAEEEGEQPNAQADDDKPVDGRGLQLGKKDRQVQLCAYLEVFSKFKNPRALSKSSDLHSYFMSLCSTAELSVQKLALDCILTWKQETIHPYSVRLKDLLETSKFRDTLSSFDLSVDSELIQDAHRPELMDLLIRLLFGSLLSRRGNRTSGAGQTARKGAVLGAIANVKPEEYSTLVMLMLAPFGDQNRPLIDGEKFSFTEKAPLASTRRQLGFLTLLSDVIKHLGANIVPYWPQLVTVTLNMTHHANAAAMQISETLKESDDDAKPSVSASTSSVRAIRQAGYKRLAEFFSKPQTVSLFEWDRYLPAMFSSLISPRLPALKLESSQSPSALMELFHTWSSQAETIRVLAVYDRDVLPSIFAILEVPNVKPPAVARVLDIAEHVFTAASIESEDGAAAVAHMSDTLAGDQVSIINVLIHPYVSDFLSSITPLVQKASAAVGAVGVGPGRDDLVRREISLLSSLSLFVTKPEDASHLITLLNPMMRKSKALVPEKTKAELLSIFERLLSLTPEFQDPGSSMFSKMFETFSSLFSSLRSSHARSSLIGAFAQFAKVDPALSRVCGWTANLNAMSKKRLEERDFDQLFTAFDIINDKDQSIEPREWLPLLHNMLFFLLDLEELSIRSNASAALVKLFGQIKVAYSEQNSQETALSGLFTRFVWPGLKRSLKMRSELVRRDVLNVISNAVENLGHISSLTQLQGLLAGGDQEANFFFNIHHIQVHRRARALRRLGDEVQKGVLQTKTITEIFTPLLAHFLTVGNVGFSDHNLVTEAVVCIGKLAGQLPWGAYNALLWQYLRLANEKTSNEKVYVRTAMAILDNFHFGMEEFTTIAEAKADEEVEEQAEANAGEDVEEPANEAEAKADEEVEEPTNEAEPKQEKDQDGESLAKADADKQQSNRMKIIDAVTGRLLPKLMSYLEQKDVTEDVIRIPIAVGVVRVVQCLPQRLKHTQISKLLRTLANILKSRAQETRDLVRETTCKVMSSLGVEYLPKLLRELRRSLCRGPQLAVLAFSVHSILVHLMASESNPITSLDQGAKDLVEIAVEDIFGGTGEDRESIGNKTTYREVKHSKGMDMFERVAQVIVPHRMADVLQPLRDILQQTEVPKTIRQVEECLRRISSGISANPLFDSHKFLILCATLIRRDAGFLQARKPETMIAKNRSTATYNYAVLLKHKDVEDENASKDHYSRNAHRFVAFGLDLLVTALRRSRFDFTDEQILVKLNSMVTLVGETTLANESSVLELSLKAVAGIVKVPVSKVDTALPVFINQIFTIIKRFGSIQAEVVQTAFRTLTTILRECKQVEMNNDRLANLLKMVGPDLEEPAVQSTLFGLLRAIVSRRFVVPELYEVMDKVAEMLVTNQSTQVRELCRVTYLQFLLDYPQGKQRLKNQLSFLAKNLGYEYESGRLSLMELLDAIFQKFGDELLQEHADMFFVSLAMVLANDSSSKCKQKGASLLKSLYRTMSEEQRHRSVEMCHAWASQQSKPELCRIGIQIYGVLFEALPEEATGWLPKALEVVSTSLSECADDLEALESTVDETIVSAFDNGVSDGSELDWQLPYHGLQTLTKLHQADASRLLSFQSDEVARMACAAIRRLLLFPHKWVRIASSRLLGSIYRSLEATAPNMMAIDVDPVASLLAQVDTAKKLCLQLRSRAVDDSLGLQAVKNLVWIGKCFSLYPVTEEEKKGGGKNRQRGSCANKKVATEEEAEVKVLPDQNESEGEDDQEDAGEDEDEKEQEQEDEDEDEIDLDDDQESNIDNAANIAANALGWLFTKLSYQARTSALGHRANGIHETQWSIQPASIFRFFAAIATQLEDQRVERLLPSMLTPLVRIIDDTVVKNSQMDDLKTLALEVQNLLQSRLSTLAFTSVYSAIRRRQQQRRQERKTAKLMQSILDPEKAAQRKAKRNKDKHLNRKRKNQIHSNRKEKFRPIKRVRT